MVVCPKSKQLYCSLTNLRFLCLISILSEYVLHAEVIAWEKNPKCVRGMPFLN